MSFPVVGRLELIPSTAKNRSAYGVIIAMPSAARSRVREAFEICTSTGLRVLMSGRANVSVVLSRYRDGKR